MPARSITVVANLRWGPAPLGPLSARNPGCQGASDRPFQGCTLCSQRVPAALWFAQLRRFVMLPSDHFAAEHPPLFIPQSALSPLPPPFSSSFWSSVNPTHLQDCHCRLRKPCLSKSAFAAPFSDTASTSHLPAATTTRRRQRRRHHCHHHHRRPQSPTESVL